MSIHHLERAALTKLPASKKLAFMAICDDADKLTRIAVSPGLDAIMEWAGIGKSQALALLKELVDEGYLERVKAGRKGQRPEFRVFAHVACCELHDAYYADQDTTAEGSDQPDPNETDAQIPAGDEASQGIGSGQPDPNGGVALAIGSGKGSGEGSGLDRTPYVSPVSNTPHPPQSGGVAPQSITIPAGAIDEQLTAEAAALGVTLVPSPTACPRHGATMAAGCRGCGTTPRLVDNAQRRARGVLRRISEQQKTIRDRHEAAAARAAASDTRESTLSSIRADLAARRTA